MTRRVSRGEDPPFEPTEEIGFSRDQVEERDPAFVEYASHHRAGGAGTSGAHGESPKFLLTEDESGRLHADGALPDSKARRHWLVKWPRGSRESDRAVLRNEAAYLRYARELGLSVRGAREHRQPRAQFCCRNIMGKAAAFFDLEGTLTRDATDMVMTFGGHPQTGAG